MTGIPHLLVHEHDDNVGVVVVEGLKSGTKMLCCITADNSTFELEAMADVPIGHKVALDDLKKGDTATKYCLLYTSPSPRDTLLSRMPSSA